KYLPFSVSDSGKMPTFASSNLDEQTEARRHDLRAFAEQSFMARHKAETSQMHMEAYEAARRLQSVKSAFDISEESNEQLELYGDSDFGRGCLLARRLVERGVPFVEVGQSGYDTHADNFTG